jgi:hypothetical protein
MQPLTPLYKAFTSSILIDLEDKKIIEVTGGCKQHQTHHTLYYISNYPHE